MFTFNDMHLRHSASYIVSTLILVFAGCSDLFNTGGFLGLAERIQENLIAKDVFTPLNDAVFPLDHSPKAAGQWFSSAQKLQSELAVFDTSELSDEELLNFDLLFQYIQISLLRDSFRFHDYPISHVNGPHLNAPEYFSSFEIVNRDDASLYLDELQTVESLFGGLVDGLEHRRTIGIIPPTFILEKIIIQSDSLASLNESNIPFYSSFERRLMNLETITTEQRDKLLGQCNDIVRQSIIPSYKRLSAYLRQLKHTSVSVAGVWQLPKGDDFYRYALLYHCGTENTTSELYAIGKSHLATIEGELAILSSMKVNQSKTETIPQPAESLRNMHYSGFQQAMNLFEAYTKLAESQSISASEKMQFLQADQLATVKMMTDIGIHNKQWLREQAVSFVVNHSHLSEDEAQMMVDEIVVQPGLACAEKIGFMRLQELLEDKPSSNYTLDINQLGPMPLSILEKRLAKEKQSA